MVHLDEDVLVSHAAGTLAGDAARSAEAHLQGCSACQERLHRISSLILSRTQANLGGSQATPTERVNADGSATPSGADTSPLRGPSAALGTTFGRYVLLERLGTGGMGEVYKAKDPQLDRTVALKILRPGTLGNEEGQARLWREAQSMARLSHPNVVAVHDVGRAENKVFVAMEFVDGDPLSQWLRADRQWSETLEVLLAAGHGLAAAHDGGVVHRDFKPDNVLIGKDGRARVLDFGLARQTSQKREAGTRPDLPDVALEGPEAVQLTRDGTIMGTPGYMAPEQLNGLPTDARSDQFSFCVTAWEALYGKRPFGGATLKAHAQQLAAGKLPEPPNGTPVPGWVHHALARGLKADPLERWPSMHALLKALTPRRRNTSRLLAVAALALAATASGAIYVAAQSQERLKVCGGTKERLAGIWDDAVKQSLAGTFPAARGQTNPMWAATSSALDAYSQAWTLASEETCARGRIQKTDSEQIYSDKTVCLEGLRRQLEATVRVLSSDSPAVRANALRAVRSLDPVSQCTDVLALSSRRRQRASSQTPEEEALGTKLLDARALYDSGQFAKCAEWLVDPLKAGGPPWLLADGWLIAGRCQLRAGQNAAAEKSFFEAAVLSETAGTADASARAWARLASVGVESATNSAERERQLRLARANASRTGPAPEIEAEVENGEGALALYEAQYVKARDHFKRALELQQRAFGEKHPEVGMTLNNLGIAQSKLGSYDEALATYQRALEVQIETSGQEHPNTASTKQNIAVILTRKKQLSEALDYAESALKIRKAALGEDSPEVATTLQTLAKIQVRLGDAPKALASLERALEIRKLEGPDTVAVAQVEDDLAHFFFDRRDYREALGHAQRAMELFDKNLGPENVRAAGTREVLGVILAKLGSWERSKTELQKALELRRARLGEGHTDVASSYNALGDLALAQKNFEQARQLFLKAVEVREKALGKDRPEVATDWGGLGAALMGLKHPAEAVPALERAVLLREKAADPIALALARFELAKALWETGDEGKPKALGLCEQARMALEPEQAAEVDKWMAARAP